MWVKRMADNHVIMENKKHGKTWMRTPQAGIVEVFLYNDGKRSPSLIDYPEFWHSRSAAVDPQTNEVVDVAERIQGLREDGDWDTIEFNLSKKSYTKYIANKAFGKPQNG